MAPYSASAMPASRKIRAAQKFAMVSSRNEVFQKRNRELVREMMREKEMDGTIASR
nr:hypothetical protein [Bacillus sp. SJS]